MLLHEEIRIHLWRLHRRAHGASDATGEGAPILPIAACILLLGQVMDFLEHEMARRDKCEVSWCASLSFGKLNICLHFNHKLDQFSPILRVSIGCSWC
jgi:hypothetical protein